MNNIREGLRAISQMERNGEIDIEEHSELIRFATATIRENIRNNRNARDRNIRFE